jgi:hypothetical protein
VRDAGSATACPGDYFAALSARSENRARNSQAACTYSQISITVVSAAEGDMESGNNLAMEARLLSDDLVKP